MTQDFFDGCMHGLRVIERLRQQQHQACKAIALRGDVGQVGQCDQVFQDIVQLLLRCGHVSSLLTDDGG
ncbi:hypothetical protein APR50_24285 [Variovorax paradoxus]|nr:hypothetical protein APR52_35840 [Variovorax paradoxus]KPV03561.1 hypothetical protein APR50_24285 [Variovorax paradoxus]KPV05022.1 hypothetical protein APR49_23080 [Variovorax paradoxus]KPV23101.1 hypothetical protein APR51_08350 [Variovorax paradoxus]KPV32595.1 hypothetical protein APR47_19490 [Variovorax paradoxus]